jgi:xylan 1,4-beta-xylosidase
MGALTWAFEFEDEPYFAGFRALASNGIDLPVLNTFRMFAQMSGRRVTVTSTHDAGVETIRKAGVRAAPDVSALASIDGGKLWVLAWHYHDDDVSGPAAAIELKISGLPREVGNATATEYRIDAEHSNAFAAWQKLGSPQQPTAGEYAELERAGRLAKAGEPGKLSVADGQSTIQFHLPRQAVSLWSIQLTPPSP